MSQEGCGKSKNKATSTVQLNRRFLHISKHISVCKPLRPAGLLRLDQFEKIERNPSPARVSALQTVFEKYSAAYARSENVQEGSRVSPRAIEVSRQFIAGTLVSLLVFTPLYKSFAEEVGPGAMSTIETVAGNPLTLAAPVEESAIAPVPADAGVDAAEPSMTSPDISGSMTPSASNDAMGEIPSPTPSVTEVPAPTALATPTPQPSPTDFSSPLPFASEEPGATPLPEGTQTPEATPTPETTPLPLPTETPEPEPTPITTPSPTPAQDVLPEISPTPTPEPTNIQLPSATPTPEATPTPDATPVPDASPAPSPEFSPTPSPEISATSVLAALPPEELARLKQELREELIKELAAQAESTTGAVALSATSSLASGNLQERSAFEDAQCTLVGEGELYCSKSKNVGLEKNAAATDAYAEIFSAPDADGSGDREIFTRSAGMTSQLTHNDTDDINPVQDPAGGLAVWQTLEGEKWVISVYDEKNGGVRIISHSGGNCSNPKVEDGRIVWQEWIDGNWEIIMAIPSAGAGLADSAANGNGGYKTLRLTQNSWPDVNPQIAEGLVVWEGYKDGAWQVFAYDFSTGAVRQLSRGTVQNKNPRIAVLWDAQGTDRVESYEFDVAKGELKLAGSSPVAAAADETPSAPSKQQPPVAPDAAAMPTSATGTKVSAQGSAGPENDDDGVPAL